MVTKQPMEDVFVVYYLFFIVFLIFSVTLLISKGLIIRPSVILIGIMTFSCLAAIYLSYFWDFNLSSTTVSAFALSMIFISF